MVSIYIDEKSIQKEAETNWDNSPTLREEFNGSYNTYFAYLKAHRKGMVKISTSKSTNPFK